MHDSALNVVKSLSGWQQLAAFANQVMASLDHDLNQSEGGAPAFTESRAKALLRATNLIDDPTLHSFDRLVSPQTAAGETAVRLALYDLLRQSELATSDQLPVAASQSPDASPQPQPIPWLPLAVAAFAWKSQYPLYQLNPASPPDTYSPAGQVLKRAAHFIRRQVQRSATERDKLGRKVAFEATPTAGSGQTGGELRPAEPIAPLPPHFRPPIPVRYPEVARETIHLDPDEESEQTTAVSRGQPITITDEDLTQGRQQPDRPVTMPPIRIRPEQVRPERPPEPSVVMPNASAETRSGFADAVRQMFSRDREPMKTTKLRIVVQEYPDGPGLYGLQVHVRCRGIQSYVAGTTNREGKFLCELPVRVHTGLTYDVDVTWPRDMNSDVERKSITLNADRTQFTLPFYHRLNE